MSYLEQDHVIWELLGNKVSLNALVGERRILIDEGLLAYDEEEDRFIFRIEGGVKIISFPARHVSNVHTPEFINSLVRSEIYLKG